MESHERDTTRALADHNHNTWKIEDSTRVTAAPVIYEGYCLAVIRLK